MKTHEIVAHLAEFKLDKGNPAEPPRLVKLKPITKPCEDCGVECVNRTVDISLRFSPVKHWRRRCNVCKKWQHPQTGAYTSNPHELNAYYSKKRNIRKK